MRLSDLELACLRYADSGPLCRWAGALWCHDGEAAIAEASAGRVDRVPAIAFGSGTVAGLEEIGLLERCNTDSNPARDPRRITLAGLRELHQRRNRAAATPGE